MEPRAELGGEVWNCQSDKTPPSTNKFPRTEDDGSDLLLPELPLFFLKPSLGLAWLVLRLPPAIVDLALPENDSVFIDELGWVGYKSSSQNTKQTATAGKLAVASAG